MRYIAYYASPLGDITLESDGKSLTGLWFNGQKYSDVYLSDEHTQQELPVFNSTRKWLDIYFSGKQPNFEIPICFVGTDFQIEVWEILSKIPYGKSMTYGEIADILAERRGIKRMSAQAVGNAVGRNRISIIVPCHRVIGKNGSLTGYAGGIERKRMLLQIEANKYK